MKYLDDVTTLTYKADRCIGCKRCVQVCPHGVFKMAGNKAKLMAKDQCIECGACKMNCPSKAIDVEAGVGCAQAIISSYIRKNKFLYKMLYVSPLTKWYFDSK